MRKNSHTAVEFGIRRSPGCNRDSGSLRPQFIVPALEVRECGGVLKKNEFAVGLSARLKTKSHLRQRYDGCYCAAFIKHALAAGAADAEAALTHRRDDEVSG